jgi:hypothetical protein
LWSLWLFFFPAVCSNVADLFYTSRPCAGKLAGLSEQQLPHQELDINNSLLTHHPVPSPSHLAAYTFAPEVVFVDIIV